jgi:hypothetical protein
MENSLRALSPLRFTIHDSLFTVVGAHSQLFIKPSLPGHILLLLFNREERRSLTRRKEEKDENPVFDSIDRSPGLRVSACGQH